MAEGSLDFDLLEAELVYREGKLHSIATFGQNEAHKLIEEFMVAANVAVASYLEAAGVPLVFRVHPRPGAADLDRLRETLAHFGIMLPKPDQVRSQDLQRAIRAAEGGPGEKFVNVQVLRAMRLAVYSPENVGHYGLAKVSYCHFTSPIRRYPTSWSTASSRPTCAGSGTGRGGGGARAGAEAAVDLTVAARHSSEQERNAAAAEKDLVEWRIFRFLKERLGDELDGVVVDITRAGLAGRARRLLRPGARVLRGHGRRLFHPALAGRAGREARRARSTSSGSVCASRWPRSIPSSAACPSSPSNSVTVNSIT